MTGEPSFSAFRNSRTSISPDRVLTSSRFGTSLRIVCSAATVLSIFSMPNPAWVSTFVSTSPAPSKSPTINIVLLGTGFDLLPIWPGVELIVSQ
ncbi:hypothetical protein D3C81_1684820 [compost metagenome]